MNKVSNLSRETVGSVAALALFYPLLTVLAGLPTDIGAATSLLFIIGGWMAIVSLSILLSITLLRVQKSFSRRDAPVSCLK